VGLHRSRRVVGGGDQFVDGVERDTVRSALGDPTRCGEASRDREEGGGRAGEREGAARVEQEGREEQHGQRVGIELPAEQSDGEQSCPRQRPAPARSAASARRHGGRPEHRRPGGRRRERERRADLGTHVTLGHPRRSQAPTGVPAER
jgi:hypothetical protein